MHSTQTNQAPTIAHSALVLLCVGDVAAAATAAAAAAFAADDDSIEVLPVAVVPRRCLLFHHSVSLHTTAQAPKNNGTHTDTHISVPAVNNTSAQKAGNYEEMETHISLRNIMPMADVDSPGSRVYTEPPLFRRIGRVLGGGGMAFENVHETSVYEPAVATVVLNIHTHTHTENHTPNSPSVPTCELHCIPTAQKPSIFLHRCNLQ